MLRQMNDMPAGTIGFEAVGEVEDDDWEEAVEPLLRREMADGHSLRLLYLLGPEARDVEGDAMSADTGFICAVLVQVLPPSCSKQGSARRARIGDGFRRPSQATRKCASTIGRAEAGAIRCPFCI